MASENIGHENIVSQSATQHYVMCCELMCCVVPSGNTLRCCVIHKPLVSVKRKPPNTENWLRKLYDKNYNNDTSNEDKHETNYSVNNDTRNMHIT